MEHFLQGCKAALQIMKSAAFHPMKCRILPTVKANLNKPSAVEFHVVLGNEACDLDSTVSAIALAYFLSKTSPSKNLEYVPVLNIPRQDFPLRTESTFLLKEHGISEEHLTFRDEIDLASLYESGQLVLTLVDHNVLPSSDSFMEDVVASVIDHHTLERKPTPSCRVTSQLVGSCATLVAERIFCGAPNILDLQLASLLHGTIVLDCVNMATVAGKVTPKDSEYVTLLENIFPDLPPRTAVFNSLQKAKFDVSDLTTEQMLRKDMKTLMSRDICLAISAIYISLEDFLHRINVESDLRVFCDKHGYNVLITMAITFSSENEPVRQIAVYSPHQEHRTLVCKVLEQATNPPLDLSPIASNPCENLAAYHQGKTTASRKKVLPLLKDFLRKRDLGDSSSNSMQPFQDNEKNKGHVGGGAPLANEGLEDNQFIVEFGDQFDNPDNCVGEEPRAARFYYGFKKQTDDGAEDENSFPPTPMNSLVEGCPLDRGLPKLTAEDILERFSQIAALDSEDKTTSGKK
ncbi:prune homolog [Pelobates cultripes]|uniref:Prune homolog n=1 Tax=Pelobates cultripes TaxID=61616 RepID=A0AAD1TID1_PELCU|nr:prune homolog [Pelobates cultripes]CAH2327149.1 prune homolog [Pelobates cultripes]